MVLAKGLLIFPKFAFSFCLLGFIFSVSMGGIPAIKSFICEIGIFL